MRILVNDFAGHPFQVQLSRELARRGHEVLHLHCASFVTGKGKLARSRDDPGSFEVEGLDLGASFSKYSPFARRNHELQYGAMFAARADAFAPEVVLSANTPLLTQRGLLRWAARNHVRFVFWQQDVYSVAITRGIRRRLPLVGHAAGWIFQALEKRLLQASDHIVAISEDFRPILRRWGISQDKVTVIENWAPLDELPTVGRNNRWATENGLTDRRVVLYAGTLGLKHNPELLLDLATGLRDRDDTKIVVVSEGLGSNWLAKRAAEHALGNLVLLPFQPYERLPEVFGSADVLVAILEPDASVFSVPSKVLSYFCAARALLAAIPSDNLAARTITRRGAGLVSDPRNSSEFLANAITLLDDADMRDRYGLAARAYAERAFNIARIGDRFEALLDPRGRRFAEEGNAD